jgi:hypothetical protein
MLLVAVAVCCAPAASAVPTSPLCDDGSYREAHPLICDTGAPGAFPGAGGRGGGGGSGGLLGTIGGILHGLTGGLL